MSELALVFPQIQALPPYALVAFRCDLCHGDPTFWYESAAQIVRRKDIDPHRCPCCGAATTAVVGYALPGAPATFLEAE
jgi:hypothetical protein